jgi:hypothetical protein
VDMLDIFAMDNWETNQLMKNELLHNGLEHAGRDKSYQFQFMGKII